MGMGMIDRLKPRVAGSHGRLKREVGAGQKEAGGYMLISSLSLLYPAHDAPIGQTRKIRSQTADADALITLHSTTCQHQKIPFLDYVTISRPSPNVALLVAFQRVAASSQSQPPTARAEICNMQCVYLVTANTLREQAKIRSRESSSRQPKRKRAGYGSIANAGTRSSRQ